MGVQQGGAPTPSPRFRMTGCDSSSFILVPKLHLGMHLSQRLSFAHRHSSQRSNGVAPASHSCAEE